MGEDRYPRGSNGCKVIDGIEHTEMITHLRQLGE
jgi:hypothetical protein